MSNSILLIDHEPIVLDVLKVALEQRAFTVTVASTVSDGIKHLETQPFGALLVDQELSDGTGLDVIRRARDRQPFCACFMTTSYANAPSILEALRLGAVDYFEKPLPQMSLVQEKIRSAIETQRVLYERQTLVLKLQSLQRAQTGAFERDTETALLQQALDLAREHEQQLRTKHEAELFDLQHRFDSIKRRHLRALNAIRAASAALSNVLDAHQLPTNIERDLREARRLIANTVSDGGAPSTPLASSVTPG